MIIFRFVHVVKIISLSLLPGFIFKLEGFIFTFFVFLDTRFLLHTHTEALSLDAHQRDEVMAL